jgi:hypothetical protein
MAISIAQKLTDFAKEQCQALPGDDPCEVRIRRQVRQSDRLPIRRYARTRHGSVHTPIKPRIRARSTPRSGPGFAFSSAASSPVETVQRCFRPQLWCARTGRC